jgi:uncharacterized protein (DUF983 family)
MNMPSLTCIMNEPITDTPAPDPWLALCRGFIGRCPRCGKGALFARYLKQVQHCGVCGEEFGHIRADDGPAWMTILIVGHILAPILLNVIPNSTWPDWVSMIVWPGLTLLLALCILPRAKGVFIAMIWHMGCIGSEK